MYTARNRAKGPKTGDFMDILSALESRCLVQDVSDRAGIAKLPPGTTFYVGIDPTSPYLQIGNLIPILVAIHLAKLGLKPLILFGGATGSIGDPSGKTAERSLLTQETVDSNVRSHQALVSKILSRVGVEAEFVNNFDWINKLTVIDFLRDAGKYLTVNYMLQKEHIRKRVEGDGISYTEFSYMLIQAFDFYHLYQAKKCALQIGGSDQWGNITAGLELIRKRIQGEAFALSWPLIVDKDGVKFGKTGKNPIWLNAEATSPYRFHQFFLNVDDSEAIRYLKIFTFHSLEKIAEVEAAMRAAPEKREAQNLLADSMCSLIHGEEATKDAKHCARVLFGESLAGLSESQLNDIFADVPSLAISKEQAAGASFIDLLTQASAVKSKGEARKLIESGGAYINNERISENLKLSESAYAAKRLLVLRTGRKNYYLVRVGD